MGYSYMIILSTRNGTRSWPHDLAISSSSPCYPRNERPYKKEYLMNHLKLTIAMASFLILFGCNTAPTGAYQLADAKTGVVVSDLESRVIKADCLIEKNKMMLPIAPQLSSCKSKEAKGPLASFMAGACGSDNLRQEKKYNTELLKAKKEREEVYSICLSKGGLSEIWVATPKS
jgi:hypothetical protein